jgi:glycosyltransferase involved in cell wall biosynthesis
MVGPFGLHPNKTMRSRALRLAQSLSQRAHQLMLIMPPWQTPIEADQRWTEGGVEIHYTSLAGGMPGIAWRLLRETLTWEPDVVHCFKPKAYSGLVMWWLWQFHRNRLRLVLDADDWEGWGGWNDQAPYSPLERRFFAWQEAWGYRHCHALTVASRALQGLSWSLGVPGEQVLYLPNGPGLQATRSAGHSADYVKFHELEAELQGRPTILLYSRLFEADVGRLVRVLQGVKKAIPEMAVLKVGDALYQADSEAFRSGIERAKLGDALFETGWVEQEQLPDLLRLADVGLYLMDDTLLNRTKCPVKLADLLSLGIPVVAESVGQLPEYVVHGETGRLRPVGNEAELILDLVELLMDPAERQRLSVGAERHISAQFSWDRLAEIAESAYLG